MSVNISNVRNGKLEKKELSEKRLWQPINSHKFFKQFEVALNATNPHTNCCFDFFFAIRQSRQWINSWRFNFTFFSLRSGAVVHSKIIDNSPISSKLWHHPTNSEPISIYIFYSASSSHIRVHICSCLQTRSDRKTDTNVIKYEFWFPSNALHKCVRRQSKNSIRKQRLEKVWVIRMVFYSMNFFLHMNTK